MLHSPCACGRLERGLLLLGASPSVPSVAINLGVPYFLTCSQKLNKANQLIYPQSTRGSNFCRVASLLIKAGGPKREFEVCGCVGWEFREEPVVSSFIMNSLSLSSHLT